MKTKKAIKILQKYVNSYILGINKPANFFLDDYSHDFNVYPIVFSENIKIITAEPFVALCIGCGYNLKKSVDEGGKFLSARPKK